MAHRLARRGPHRRARVHSRERGRAKHIRVAVEREGRPTVPRIGDAQRGIPWFMWAQLRRL